MGVPPWVFSIIFYVTPLFLEGSREIKFPKCNNNYIYMNNIFVTSSSGLFLTPPQPINQSLHIFYCVQMDEKAREIEKLNLLLGSAGEEREKVETRIATMLGVSGEGLRTLRSELDQIRTQVRRDYNSG